MPKKWKLGPLDCAFHEESWNYDGTVKLDRPTLYIYLTSQVMPWRTIAMQKNETEKDAMAIACHIASALFSGWLGEVGKFRTENEV